MSVLTAFRSMLTQSPATVLLTHKGVPVTAPVKVSRWRVESDGDWEVMRTTVMFGPFPTEAEFDGAVVNVAGTDEPDRFASLVVLAPGMSFKYDAEWRFIKDPM